MLGLAWQPAANIFALTAALAISACMLASSPTATSWFEEGPAQLSDSATEEVIDDGERERSTDSIVHSGWSRLAASRGMRATRGEPCFEELFERSGLISPVQLIERERHGLSREPTGFGSETGAVTV